MLGRYRESVRVWSDPIGRGLVRLRLRPNHLTLIGLGISLLSASAFVAGHTRSAGVLLILAGLCDFFDGSLARASGQVTPFGGFLDSVIDRYSDLVVMLGIVVLFARTPNARGAVLAMAGLVGSVMVSYTKARAESIGVPCRIGVMERPERMICLIAGALFDLLEPALWVLAVLANFTAVQRIAFTWRATRDASIVPLLAAAALLLPGVAAAQTGPPAAQEAAPAAQQDAAPATPDAAPATPSTPPPAKPRAAAPAPLPPERERSWARAVEAFQQGDTAPLLHELNTEAALTSPIGDYVRLLLADALARRDDWTGARTMAASVADRHRDSRVAALALVVAATAASRGGDEAAAQATLVRLIDTYPDAPELPEALYLLGATAEARGQLDRAVAAYRELTILAPTTGYADGAADRVNELLRAGARAAPLSLAQRTDRAERLLRGGVPKTAADEAERIATEATDPSIAVRALKVLATASQRLGRHDVAARAMEAAVARAPADLKANLQLEQARLLVRSGQRDKSLGVLASVVTSGTETEAAEAAFQRARVLDDLRRDADAAAAYRALATRYPAREVAGAALWRLGWLAYVKGDLKSAEQNWTRIVEIPGGRSQRIAALYWTGRAKGQAKAPDAAKRLYQRVVTESPRSYYGMLASQRLGREDVKAGAADPPFKLPENPADAIAHDPGFARVDLLRRIGLTEFALLELDHVVQRSVGDSVRLYGLSGTYMREEQYHLGLRILRRHFSALAATGHPSLPRAFWEMLYPFGYRTQVTEAASRAGIDPFLVAAVVREESSYHPRAVSRAGARGLMQLMPGTAQPMAEVRGWSFRGGDLLDDPGSNIQLGTSFLAGLLREFGDARLALAAYNAGPRRAREWWKARRNDDIEAFVEEIPFDETRQYVKRVMLSWEEYKRIYGTT